MAITTLALTAGVQGHVTVADANAGDAPLADSTISWAFFDPSHTGLTMTPDLVGGFFVDASSAGVVEAVATWHGASSTSVGSTLTITVSAAVAVEYLSP